MVFFAVQGHPAEDAVLVEQAAVVGSAAGQGDGAGVGAEEVFDAAPGGDVGVAGEQNFCHAAGRRILRAIPVAVGEKDGAALPFLEQILGGAGEAGAQGTDAVVAVALHPENVRGNGIELVDDVLRVVFIPGIVGAGIGQVAQQDELLCPGLPI